ncbi:MAG: hypothetical protein HWN68_19430 [Desulfobacterales bacterium]|nr:hypothetical protein [Desulfobacterales bacterium]
MQKADSLGNIGLILLIKVVSHGSSLYLRLDKRVWETFDIQAGDRLEVKFQKHYRPKLGPGGKPLV